MIKKTQSRCACSLLLLAALVSNAQAAVTTELSVNFNSGGAYEIPTDALNTAGVIPSPFWNNSTSAGLTSAMLSDGSTHAINVALNSTALHTQITSPANNDQRLMGSSYDLHGGTQTLSVSGLPSEFTSRGYDVYVYLWGNDNGNQQGVYRVDLGGAPSVFFRQEIDEFDGFDNSGQSESVGTAGLANYVKIAGVGQGQSSFNVEVTNIDGTNALEWTLINGFQVVAVPEPGTVLFLASLGVLPALRRRRVP